MLMYARDAIMQDINVVRAWLNCRYAIASNMCLRDIGCVVLRLGQWLGRLSLMESSVRSNSISYRGIALSRSWFRLDKFRCKFLSELIPIKLSLWMMASIQLSACGCSSLVWSSTNAFLWKWPQIGEAVGVRGTLP